MSEQAAAKEPRKQTAASALLSGGAGLWYLATFAGQIAFFYYICAFYGPTTLTGNYEGWDKNPFLTKGYIEGDEMGNLAFAAHVIVAAIVTFAGMIQFIPQIRARAIAFHRWNGRVFMTGSIAAALSGFYMVWMRGEIDDWTNAIAISLNGVLILAFAALAWGNAIGKNIAAHRRWATRTFMVANGVFFLRIMVSCWLVLTQKSLGAMFYVFEFASYLAPLLLLEIYLRARNAGAIMQMSAAAVLTIAAGLTAIGVFGFYMVFMKTVLDGA